MLCYSRCGCASGRSSVQAKYVTTYAYPAHPLGAQCGLYYVSCSLKECDSFADCTVENNDGRRLKLNASERYVLTTSKASVIRGVLSLLLARVKSEGDVSPGTLQSLEALSREGCDRLIVELRRPREPPAGISPRVRNLRVSHLGQVLVVSGEVSSPEILHEIEMLRRPRYSFQSLTTTLLTFVHKFLSVLGAGVLVL